MANMTIGPVFPIAGNEIQMTSKGKIQVTDADGKIKTLSQDEFKKQLVKNADKIAAGEDVEFKDSKKGLIAAAAAGAAVVGTLAALGIAVQKRALKPAKIAKTDVLLQKAGKRIQNFGYAIGKKVSVYSQRAYHAAADFIAKFVPKAEAKVAQAAEKVEQAAEKVAEKV